jgi:hypothetical protein
MKKTISTSKTAVANLVRKVVAPKAAATKHEAVKKVAAKKVVVKKAAPKKAVKKAVKKVTPKVPAKLPLQVTSDPEAFWLTDGQILNSLHALADAFLTMEKSVYQYHITKTQNDFAAWVEHVFSDPVLAASLRKAKTAKSARTIILKHVALYYV